MASAEGGKGGGQVVQFSVFVGLKGLQDRQGVGQEHDVVGSMGADLYVGYCCFQGLCLSFVVRGVEAGSKADLVFSSSWVLDVDSCPSIANCFLGRAVSVDECPGLSWIVLLQVLEGVSLILRAALRVFWANSWHVALYGGFLKDLTIKEKLWIVGVVS